MTSPHGKFAKSRFRPAFIVAGIVVANVLLITPALSETVSPPVATEQIPAIRVVEAVTREMVETLSADGSIIARQEAQVVTDLNGMTVLELSADQGDRVARGEVLARLDQTTLDLQLAQLVAQRTQALAQVAQVRSQITDAEIAVRQGQEAFDRHTVLRQKAINTKVQLDNTVNALDSAKARLATAHRALEASEAQIDVYDAQINDVRNNISKTNVKAPADGLILTRAATLGAVVGPGSGPLFRIAINNEFELAARVAESQLPRLKKGMQVKVSIPGLDMPVDGTIRLIEPEINRLSRLGTIRVSLADNPNIRVGSFARAEVELLRRKGVAVPSTSVVYKGRDAFLQKVESSVVHAVPVTLGARADGFVEIRRGLAAGDQVVSRAGTFVADGDRVRPVLEVRTGAVSQ